MVLQELEDRLYTSTEVANILGVSLRSVYRYLEDAKLKAEMKTATGRHRFTKQNIVDFMSPQATASAPVAAPAKAAPAPAEPVAPAVTEEPKAPETPVPTTPTAPAVAEPEPKAAPEAEKEEVDWLSKFRQAAEKYKTDQDTDAPTTPTEEAAPAAETVSGLAAEPEAPAAETSAESSSPTNYYKSAAGGLKDIAQNIDKSAKKASLNYAFTMDAGLSLHKPISPFSLIHVYVKSEDLAFFEKILDLAPAELGDAQLCLIADDDASIYSGKTEVHGLNVVSNDRLRADLLAAGKSDLAGELS